MNTRNSSVQINAVNKPFSQRMTMTRSTTGKWKTKNKLMSTKRKLPLFPPHLVPWQYPEGTIQHSPHLQPHVSDQVAQR